MSILASQSPTVPASLAPGIAPVLRVMTAGSVDDGKSTLIGRLLHDLDRIDHDVLEDLRRASLRRGRGELDLSLFTDGLSDEREQGITIDVAYRYFAFGGRSFILADSPGHVEYTRNMVCAASQSDVALILVDARHGAQEQTRRHAQLAALMGVRERVYLVNKMDLIGFDRARYDAHHAQIAAIEAGIAAQSRAGAGAFRVLPICALDGDHLARRGDRMPWYDGPLLADLLQSLPGRLADDRREALRFPVQGLIRPTGRAADPRWHDFRGLSGRLESGRLVVGDRVRVAVVPGRLAAEVHEHPRGDAEGAQHHEADEGGDGEDGPGVELVRLVAHTHDRRRRRPDGLFVVAVPRPGH
jgi:sulfate adenylyltransferase subunit 1